MSLRPPDVGERLGDVARGARVNVADEAQRDVVVLGLEPARADDAPARQRHLAHDGFRQFQGGKQARHGRALLPLELCDANLRADDYLPPRTSLIDAARPASLVKKKKEPDLRF